MDFKSLKKVFNVKFIKRKNLTLGQRHEIIGLWNNEYPVNLQYKNISELDEYLEKLKDQNHILLVDENDWVKGWYADFIRHNEWWFLAILSSEIQGGRWGTQIIKKGKEVRTELNGWVVNSDNYLKANGQFYKSPIGFYRKQGFETLEDFKLETERISAIKIKWARTD